MVRRILQSGLGFALIPIVLLVMIGTVGYSTLEGWSLLDALYATIITITTVGYGDLSPQTFGGRIFAMVFTLSTIGLASYAITTLASVVIDLQAERSEQKKQERRMKQIAALQDHVIICGGSTIGRVASYFFQRQNQPLIIIENDEERLRLVLLHFDQEYLRKKFGRYHDITQAVDVTADEQLPLETIAERIDVPYILADPTDDSSLLAAGIERARGVVASLDSDEKNLFTVVSARALATQLHNTKLRIVSVVNDDKNGHKLQIAGADQLILPEKASGQQVVLFMNHPHLANFWMKSTLKDGTHTFAEYDLAHYPEWVGKRIVDLHRESDLVVLALWRNGEFDYVPPVDAQLTADDTIITYAPKSTTG